MTTKRMWLIIGLIVIIGAGIVAVAHKPNKTNSSASTNATSTSTKPASTSGSSTSTKSGSSAIITTKTDATLGPYLVAANGKPLYTNKDDKIGVANCTASCIVVWPVYVAPSASGSLPTNVTVIKRADGKSQYAYKGMPLYYYKYDTGSTPSGNGHSDFYIAKP